MSWLIAGLVLLLGVHSLGVAAPAFRERQVTRLGEGVWKGIHALVSLAGLALIVWGYAVAR
ncbi:MAG: NnrU family protein, partial [Casimicrobiaceae bacterium]